jgi:hypothetical protein
MKLSRKDLLKIYGDLPGRTPETAARTNMSTLVLIDIIIWTENNGHHYNVGGKVRRAAVPALL